MAAEQLNSAVYFGSVLTISHIMFLFKSSLLATVLVASAAARVVRKQDTPCTFAVPIIARADETTLVVGEAKTFTWDPSMFSPDDCVIPEIDLETAADQTPVAVLGRNFDPLAGMFSFIVPDVTPGGYFFTFVISSTERIINPIVLTVTDA